MSVFFSAIISCFSDVWGDKYVLMDKPSYIVDSFTVKEVNNVILAGSEDMLNGICAMTCTKEDCIGFSSSVNSVHNCHLYSKLNFVKASDSTSASKIGQKLFLRWVTIWTRAVMYRIGIYIFQDGNH